MQRRKGAIAEPYINHLLEVAELLVRTQPGFDLTLIIAGLLHDTLEDTETSREELAHAFGEDVSALVAEVSDDKTLKPEVRRLAADRGRAQQIGAGAESQRCGQSGDDAQHPGQPAGRLELAAQA